jgi:hypothetical protein
MSRTARAFVAVVSIVGVATAFTVLTNPSSHHRLAPVATVVRTAPPAASPAAPPSAEFAAETFLSLLTRVDPSVATRLINALSPADRAALAIDIETRTGLAAG